jgi:Uncharacterized conserved protein, contains double-stranded beta-helix domain
MRKFVWEDREQEAMPAVGTGQVLRRFVSGEQMTVAQVQFQAGSEVLEHQHENEQFTLVLSGTMEFTVEGQKVLVGPGEVLHLPARVPHSARAEVDSVLIDVFSPPRTDWIAGPDPLEPRD